MAYYNVVHVSISSTSEEVQSLSLCHIVLKALKKFPLVQLPKKFKAEKKFSLDENHKEFPLVQLPKKFKEICFCVFDAMASDVSISSTSEEVQSKYCVTVTIVR